MRCLPSYDTVGSVTRRVAFWIILGVGLCGCSRWDGVSEDSTLLDRVIAPRVVPWAKGSEETLSLAQISRQRGYDLFCVVPEYHPLDWLKKTTPITSYHSKFGVRVPENRLAIVAVRAGSAHAALVDTLDFSMNIIPTQPCVDAGEAHFRRAGKSEFGTPEIWLEGS